MQRATAEPMPTQRPFFSNFLAAFRAHSAIQTSKAQTAPSSTAQTAHPSPGTSPSQPRTITTSTKPSGATTAALTTLHSPRTSNSPLSRSPGPSTSPVAENASAAKYITPRGRRGSDSSSEGFRDVLGAEKWYIGGRTAAGEERYFKLGVIKRHTSRDRLSLDRLSL
ncbi:hypothetical protein ONS95_009783 [Cadophora gregata]|uniref:uncharacterized protein n=1 Tax=Cadophora gregata TaxID=51156 RepID=UPI0026DDCB51|nr:uncharacterized protein ONS95_009783 [Cadophora gregata]KAK0121489.1 hypothetical protein ONS95_009783 [Cadophora gregata]